MKKIGDFFKKIFFSIGKVFKFIFGNLGKLLKKLIDRVVADKKFRIIFIIIVVILIILLLFIFNSFGSKKNISYDRVKTALDEKEEIIVYYYNSNSSNKNNKEVKKALDKLGINYYIYDDAKVDKKEYDDLLKLLNINKEIFGAPSIIYIKKGRMYANIIKIDDPSVVKTFVDGYNLTKVK